MQVGSSSVPAKGEGVAINCLITLSENIVTFLVGSFNEINCAYHFIIQKY